MSLRIHFPPFSILTLLMFHQFFVLAYAGAADDFGRSRNILPLPEISEDAGGDPGSDFWRPFANQGINAEFSNWFVRHTPLLILIHQFLMLVEGSGTFAHPLACTIQARVQSCPMPKEMFLGLRYRPRLSHW